MNKRQIQKKSKAVLEDNSNKRNKISKVQHKKTEEHQYALTRKNKDAKDLFKQIEIAKKEWEKTMDCVDDMIILTDSDGIIKRVNKSVKNFTGKSYKEIFGKTWEDVIIENDLEAMTLYAGCTELLHKPTNRWFELNAYPFEDSELQFSGSVLTLHETTEVKKITEKVEKSNKKIEKNRKKLESALNKISSLMQNVTQCGHNGVRFFNPHLKKCYEVKNCTKEDCPCYGHEAMRCWQVAGTFCGGKVQGTFAQKYGSCSECEVYKKATSDPIYQIGEHFNNMMYILDMGKKEPK